MSTKFIQLHNNNIFNDEYILAVYYVRTIGGIDILDAVEDMFFDILEPLQDSSQHPLVFRVDRDQDIVYVAFPVSLFNKGDLSSVLSITAGRLMDSRILKSCRLLDIWFPSNFLHAFKGPACSIDELRSRLGIEERPLLATALSSSSAEPHETFLERCYEFWLGGGDIVRDSASCVIDEKRNDEGFIKSLAATLRQAESDSGEKKMFIAQVSAADLEQISSRIALWKAFMPESSYGFAIHGAYSGWTCMQSLRNRYPDDFFYFTSDGADPLVRQDNAFGITRAVFTKFVRMAGSSATSLSLPDIIDSNDEYVRTAKLALRLTSNGYFFEQTWGLVPRSDRDTIQEVAFAKKMNGMKFQNISSHYKLILHKQQACEETSAGGFFAQNWRGIKTATPIVSGSFHPALFALSLSIIADRNLVIEARGSINSHPQGTRAGAAAFRQACEAWMLKQDVYSYAESHVELKQSLNSYVQNSGQFFRHHRK